MAVTWWAGPVKCSGLSWVQYSSDAAEINLRKTDGHVVCIVFGNIIHYTQSLEVYDSPFFHDLVLRNQTKNAVNFSSELQYF